MAGRVVSCSGPAVTGEASLAPFASVSFYIGSPLQRTRPDFRRDWLRHQNESQLKWLRLVLFRVRGFVRQDASRRCLDFDRTLLPGAALKGTSLFVTLNLGNVQTTETLFSGVPFQMGQFEA